MQDDSVLLIKGVLSRHNSWQIQNTALKLSLLFRSYPWTSLRCKLDYRWKQTIVSIRGIPKGTGISPRFVAQVVSINPNIQFAKEVLSSFNITEMPEQEISHFYEKNYSIFWPLWPQLFCHIYSHRAFGLLLLTVQTKATAKGHYDALESLHPTMSIWDDMVTYHYDIFVKPLPSYFPFKF